MARRKPPPSQRTTQADKPWPAVSASPRTFFKAPLCSELETLKADVAFLGVPFDQGTLGRPGARFGPNAVRDAPRTYVYNDPLGRQVDADGYFDIDADGELLRGVTMADCGDVTVVPSDAASTFDKVTAAVEKIVSRGAFPVTVGGDHSITFPIIRALSTSAPLDIVHFDAHMDYTHDIQGVLDTHGSPIRRCRELPFVGHITSIGVRHARRRAYEESQRDGVLIVTANRFRELGPEGVARLVPMARNLYITLDIDVLDPVQAPGTGTPEVGGLFYRELRDCLTALVKKGRLVGLDVVEVSPPYDHADITSQVAARLITDILAAQFPSK